MLQLSKLLIATLKPTFSVSQTIITRDLACHLALPTPQIRSYSDIAHVLSLHIIIIIIIVQFCKTQSLQHNFLLNSVLSPLEAALSLC